MSGQDNRVVSQRRLEIGRGYDVLLTVLVVAGFVSVFTVPASALTLGDYGLLALANLIYWFNGVFGWRRWDRTRAPLVGLAYFAGQYILSTFIVYWSYQNIWLLLLPLASQSIELRRRWTLVVCLLLVVSFALPLLFPARLFAGGLARPGDLTPAVVLEAILDFGLALAFILLFSELLVRERQARAELGQAHRRLGEYAGQVEQLATMRERTRLAREVHDSLGHYLTVLSVQREIVTKFLDAEPARARAREAAFRSQELVAEGLAEVRRSVAALRPSPLGDRSLPQAIRCLAGETHESGLAVSFELTGSPCALPSTVETALYRAAQEALTNVRKHAQAHSVTLRLAYEPDGVRLRVRDDGRGRRGEGARDGVGLKGLRERVAALEGSLRAENHLEGGFVVEVTLPCRAASPLTPRPSVGALSPRGRGSLPPSPWGRGCLPPSLGGGVGGGGE